ncbi:MAG: ZIP family metal transporter [Clostridia bacterium]|nr:ZIP family metal transporter [Clostridia bacterium]
MRSFLWAAGGTLMTFALTALGAALVFVFRGDVSSRARRICFGFAAGVMAAACAFSLLAPAAEMAGEAGFAAALLGFPFGAALMLLLDAALERRMADAGEEARRRALLFSAVTLHNIPEGMLVGLTLAMAARGRGAAAGAMALALGVGLQNIPEGAAIALPLRAAGMSRGRSFVLGALSGVVEPAAGMAAALAASLFAPAVPVMMAAAAGAMMFVVAAEMIPDAAQDRAGMAALMVGYALMAAMDLGLG